MILVIMILLGCRQPPKAWVVPLQAQLGPRGARNAPRIFALRPSNMRMVQCYMSKQEDSKEYLSPSQHSLARTLYVKALRDVVKIAKMAVPESAKAKKARPAPTSGGRLFHSTATAQGEDETSDSDDPVQDEMRRRALLSGGTAR